MTYYFEVFNHCQKKKVFVQGLMNPDAWENALELVSFSVRNAGR